VVITTEYKEIRGNMNNFIDIIQEAEIFTGIDRSELRVMLSCLGAEVKEAKKGDILLQAGDKPEHIGLVLEGMLYVHRDDYDGNRILVTVLTPKELFAEALCCADVRESPVTVIAEADSFILLMSFSRIIHTCSNICSHHTKLIANMLGIIANRNLTLQNRMEIVSIKSIRTKVLRFLESYVTMNTKVGKVSNDCTQSLEITVPFNREQMANYLSVERSALSHELIRMKNEGLIEYNKNKFILK